MWAQPCSVRCLYVTYRRSCGKVVVGGKNDRGVWSRSSAERRVQGIEDLSPALLRSILVRYVIGLVGPHLVGQRDLTSARDVGDLDEDAVDVLRIFRG